MVEGSPALWFGASGFEILDVVDDGVELVVSLQTTATIVGCSSCGRRATPRDRRWVTVRDAPSGDRAVRLCWRKRIWVCTDVDCDARTLARDFGGSSRWSGDRDVRQLVGRVRVRGQGPAIVAAVRRLQREDP
ncbi:MAG TPA: hypothetical protein VGR26_12890 [Acidimicrobiales bacterium]|nr:hypothetical protein [Acidimicrobiales bacterium]